MNREQTTASVERAKEIVGARKWTGDIEGHIFTIVGAGRVLAQRVGELEDENAHLTEEVRQFRRLANVLTNKNVRLKRRIAETKRSE